MLRCWIGPLHRLGRSKRLFQPRNGLRVRNITQQTDSPDRRFHIALRHENLLSGYRGEIMKRTANAQWRGDLKTGHGAISTASGVLADAQYSFSTRFEEGK